MKRFSLVLISLIFSLGIYAQDHLKFMGVDIDGNLSSFVQKMKSKGFVFEHNFDNGNGTVMSGLFTGKKVELYVFVTPKSKTVWKVVAYYPENNSWRSLKNEYNELKRSLKAKYSIEGEFEFFKSPYEEGDGHEMYALENDKCTYSTFLKGQYGFVELEISKFKQIRIAYEDIINSDLLDSEKNTIVMDDI